jgi:hypothetical protein
MDCRLYTEDGLNITYNYLEEKNPKRADIEEALSYFALADNISKQTNHEFANRHGKLGDLLAEMQEFLKDKEKELLWEGVKNIGTKAAWVGKTSIHALGAGLSGLGKIVVSPFRKRANGLNKGGLKKLKDGSDVSEGRLSRRGVNDRIKELELQLQLKTLELEIVKLKNNN